jgi:hypothetical protein
VITRNVLKITVNDIDIAHSKRYNIFYPLSTKAHNGHTFLDDRPILEAEQDRFDFLDYADALSSIILSSSTPIT